MDFSSVQAGEKLGSERVAFLQAFKKSCRRTILGMLRTSQSGHPGGSLSNLDFLSVLYAFRVTEKEEKVVVSNGHISPAVYSILAECGAIDKEQVVKEFRQVGSIFEGHVTRHVDGIDYGTGPLGAGISVAAAFALAEKLKGNNKQVWGNIGDGEMQEGQVHEMALFAIKENLSNLAVFVDWNRVQLTSSLDKTMPIDPEGFFRSKGWNVLMIDGHNDEEIWDAISYAENSDKPTAIIGKTIMGNGISFMQEDGENFNPKWHGKPPTIEQIDEELGMEELTISGEENEALQEFREDRDFNPVPSTFSDNLSPVDLNLGEPILYDTEMLTDCRSAYGKALFDLAKNNKNVLAGSADVSGSVMTKFVEHDLPEQYIEFGICEQNMVSVAGGLSLSGYVPFVSTFGAFMSSRAKDQARLNDLNQANVKMVSTHCGLSVGEDGPTHQAIDDMGSFVGMFNTHVCEPADPNHCDRIIRYAAGHNGNFYVRMGRAKLPALINEAGAILFGKDYKYEYGKTEVLKKGEKVTIVALGAAVHEAQKAVEESGVDAEIIIASSIKKFDDTLKNSIAKTGKVITVEDHNAKSGLGAAVALFCAEENLNLNFFKAIAVDEYQLSGSSAELYAKAGIDAVAIAKVLQEL